MAASAAPKRPGSGPKRVIFQMNAPAKAKRRTARKRRHGEALPKRATELLAAALELFANEDFNTVTIKDIGASTGVNTALIYYYFDDKADLFAASLEYAVEQALTNYRRLRERHSDPVDLIADWFDNHVQLAKPIRQLVKIMLDYSTSRTQRGRVVDAIINSSSTTRNARSCPRPYARASRSGFSAPSIRSGPRTSPPPISTASWCVRSSTRT